MIFLQSLVFQTLRRSRLLTTNTQITVQLEGLNWRQRQPLDKGPRTPTLCEIITNQAPLEVSILCNDPRNAAPRSATWKQMQKQWHSCGRLLSSVLSEVKGEIRPQHGFNNLSYQIAIMDPPI